MSGSGTHLALQAGSADPQPAGTVSGVAAAAAFPFLEPTMTVPEHSEPTPATDAAPSAAERPPGADDPGAAPPSADPAGAGVAEPAPAASVPQARAKKGPFIARCRLLQEANCGLIVPSPGHTYVGLRGTTHA